MKLIRASYKFLVLIQKKNFQSLVVKKMEYGSNERIQYVCPHGVVRTTSSKGGHPRQHVLYTNCPFLVNINENRKNQTWKITKLVTKHQGHMLGPDVFGGYQNIRKMSEDDIQFVNELDGVGAARRHIAERMGQKTGMT